MESAVALVEDADRTAALDAALTTVGDELRASLSDDPHVLLKPNLVKPRPLACTHVDTLDAVMDVFEGFGVESFTVAESSAGDTEAAFARMEYDRLHDDHDVELVALEDDPYREVTLAEDVADLDSLTVRVSDRLLAEETALVSVAKPKTHDTVVATLSLKNVLMGSILKTESFNDKRKMHQGYAEINRYLALLAERVYPDVAVIDGHRGMQGDGPVHGDPIESDFAIASADPLAADHVALRCMDIDPADVGYLTYIAERGMGVYDADAIDVRGDVVASCRDSYRLHETADEQLTW